MWLAMILCTRCLGALPIVSVYLSFMNSLKVQLHNALHKEIFMWIS